MSKRNNSSSNENAQIKASSSGEGEFDNPPSPQQSSGGSSSDLVPPAIGDNSSAGDIEASAEAQKLLDVKGLIEDRLAEAASSNAMSVASARNVDSAGILGVGISSGVPGKASLVLYVESPANEEAARREMFDSMGIQAASDDNLPVEVVVTGRVDAYTTNRSKFRPAPAGVSVGHYAITAGTIGGWALGRGDRSRRLLIVSNNHVLANSNAGKFGDAIIQPGAADGGVSPADQVAILERFVTIDFSPGGVNFVDCATAWCWPDRVRRDHVYHSGSPTAKFFKVGNTVVEPFVGMIVGKTGRTTDLTRGMVQATGVSVNVNYGPAGVAHFRDQFSVQSVSANVFSAGGDSGSFVWHWSGGVSPVGLLFAGGGATTFCNRMSRVVPALDINLAELA